MATENINKNCGAFIFCTATKRYLFLLRAKGRYANTWGIVGGGIEPGETTKESLVREILEELGGRIDGAKFVPIETFTSVNNKFVYQTFLIKVEEEFVPSLNNEHKGFCWVSLNNFPSPLHPGVYRTIKHEPNREKLLSLEAL